MYRKFESLSEEKRKRIIDASLEEFAENGYEQASTNTIVKKAGISKGLLFHYFGSKKNLYLYLIDYIVKYMLDKFYSTQYDSMPADIFERIMQRGLIKLRMAYDNPLMYRVLFDAFVNTPGEFKDEMQQRLGSLYSQNIQKFFSGIDTSKFRKDVNPQKAVELIAMLIDGLSTKYINMYRDHTAEELLGQMDRILEEFREYLDML